MEGKTENQTNTTLMQSIENGWLKIYDFERKVDSLKLLWVKCPAEHNNAKCSQTAM